MNFELAEIVRAARLRIFGCPQHGRHIRQGRCIDCLIERIMGVSMTPVSRILAR